MGTLLVIGLGSMGKRRVHLIPVVPGMVHPDHSLHRADPLQQALQHFLLLRQLLLIA